MVADGLCDALVSDYHYPSLVGAVRRLVRDGVCDWGQAWKLVSSGPAEVLGLSDRGQLQSECRADFIVLEPETGRVCLTVAAGEIAHLSSPVADRLMQIAKLTHSVEQPSLLTLDHFVVLLLHTPKHSHSVVQPSLRFLGHFADLLMHDKN